MNVDDGVEASFRRWNELRVLARALFSGSLALAVQRGREVDGVCLADE
jgi:hypothetical protein